MSQASEIGTPMIPSRQNRPNSLKEQRVALNETVRKRAGSEPSRAACETHEKAITTKHKGSKNTRKQSSESNDETGISRLKRVLIRYSSLKEQRESPPEVLRLRRVGSEPDRKTVTKQELDCSWLRDLYQKKKKETLQELSRKAHVFLPLLPLPEKLPKEESKYTDVFQQYIVDGLALKKLIVDNLKKVNGVESLGTGFSMERAGYWPIIRVMADETTCKQIKQQEQRKLDLVHEVTAALHNTLTHLYKASWSPKELENMIEIVINYPLKAFDLCTAGEPITTTYNFSNQIATKIGRMAFSVRHCLTVGQAIRVAHYRIGAFHTVIPSRSLDYRGVLDPLPVNKEEQAQLQYEIVHNPIAQITLTQPAPQEDPLLIHTALQATLNPESAKRGLSLVKRGNFAYRCTQQARGPLELLHGKMALIGQKEKLVDGISVPYRYMYVLVAPNSAAVLPQVHPVYFRHQCNVDIGISRNTTAQQNDCDDLESLLSNLEAGEGVRLPSKIKWCKPPEEAEFEKMKGIVVFVKDGMVYKLANKLAQVHSMGYPCCQWDDDKYAATVPGDSGAPVFLQQENEFHLIGILITERSATPVHFALKIMHARIAIQHVKEINDYKLNDLLEKYKKYLKYHEWNQSLLPPPAMTFKELQENGEGIISSSLEVCIQPH